MIDKKKINVLFDSSIIFVSHMFKCNNANELNSIYNSPFFKNFNFVFRSHYVEYFSHPKNTIPWAFGLTNRIIEELDKTNDQIIKSTISNNYRALHDIRRFSTDKLLPILKEKYEINNKLYNVFDEKNKVNSIEYYYLSRSGRRHYSLFYESLNASALTLSLGGLINYKPIGVNIQKKLNRT